MLQAAASAGILAAMPRMAYADIAPSSNDIGPEHYSPEPASEPVGLVNDIVNVAWGTPPGMGREEVEHEDPAYMQELIETEDESAVVIAFADGSKLTVGENAQVAIDEFVYDPAAKTGAQIMTLTKGAFRFISGAIPKENVSIKTPTATLGIRGTEVVIDINDDGETEASTETGEGYWKSNETGLILTVGAGNSVLIDRRGRWPLGVRRFKHKSRSLAVLEGLEGARRRWKIRKVRRRRIRRRLRNVPLRPLRRNR
jgi:hypothetical protein